MEWWRVGLALGTPWLAGALWLRVLWRDTPTAGVWPLVLGYGGLLGLLATTLLLRAQAALGLPLNFIGPTVVLALLAVSGGWRLWRQTSPPIPLSISPRFEPPRCCAPPFLVQGGEAISDPLLRVHDGKAAPGVGVRWLQLLFILLLAWLGSAIGQFDARSVVAAAVSLGCLGHLGGSAAGMVGAGATGAFVDPQRWLADATGSVYTLDAWDLSAHRAVAGAVANSGLWRLE